MGVSLHVIAIKNLCAAKPCGKKLATVGKGTMHVIQLSDPACLCKRVPMELPELVSVVSELVQLISGVRALILTGGS